MNFSASIVLFTVKDNMVPRQCFLLSYERHKLLFSFSLLEALRVVETYLNVLWIAEVVGR